MNYVYIFYAIVNFGRERETRGEGACLAKPKGKGQRTKCTHCVIRSKHKLVKQFKIQIKFKLNVK